MLLILASSLIPMDRDVQGLQFIIDLKPSVQNLLHIPMFAILTILLLKIFNTYDLGKWKSIAMVFALAGIYGLINEAVQFYIPGRYVGILDIGMNLFGAMVGIFVYLWVEKLRPRLLYRFICG